MPNRLIILIETGRKSMSDEKKFAADQLKPKPFARVIGTTTDSHS
jgi:hypothetical protein